MFDLKHFKDANQGFLGVVNILVSAFINLNQLSSNVFRLELRPSTSKDQVKGHITVSMTTDVLAASGLPGPSGLRAGNNVSSPTPGMPANPQRNMSGKYQPNSPFADEFGPLPAGWERRFDAGGRPFYVDHNNHATSWTRPAPQVSATDLDQRQQIDQQRQMYGQRMESSQQSQQQAVNQPFQPADLGLEDDLPPGWERRIAPNGHFYYIDHNTQRTSWAHPNRIQQVRVAQGNPDQIAEIYKKSVEKLGPLPAGW